MGIWSSNSSVGDVIGAELGGLMLHMGFSWQAIVLTCASIIAIVSTFFAIFVEDKPALTLVEEDSSCDKEFSLLIKHRSSFAKKGIRFTEALRIPRVLPYSITYACVKLLTYGMLFWLPFFLTREVHLPENVVGVLTASFAIGGILGGSLSGWLTDHLKGNRSVVLMPMLACTIPLIFLFEVGDASTSWIFFIIIPLTGIMNAGASNLMSSAVPADLAERSEANSTEEAKGTVTGILNGVGALGAAAGGVLIGWLQTYSWTYVFTFLIGVSATATTLLVIIMVADCREEKRAKSKLTDF
jgi:sugar phosphate permease